jgi:hypothetical protein
MSKQNVGGRIPALGREFTVIVLGVLVALGVGNWNTRSEESARGRDYVDRIEHDLRTDAVALEALLDSAEAAVESGVALLEVLNGGSSGRSPRGLVVDLLRSDFELPVADYTYREVLGSGELGLIMPAAVRSVVVTYYARAAGYHDRLVENRRDLRNPLFNEMAKTSVLLPRRLGRVDSIADRGVLDRLAESAESPTLVWQAITYQSNRSVLWGKWLEEVQSALDAIEKEGSGAF